MAKKTSNNGEATPRFTIEAQSSSRKAIAKLSIPKVPLAALGDTIDKLVEKAKEAGVEITAVRGTLAVY